MKWTIVLVVSGSILLSWCSQIIQQWIDIVFDADKKHQESQLEKQETETAITTQTIIDSFSNGTVDLSGLWLGEFPDICALLPEQFHQSITTIDVSSNDLESIDTDLSCLPFLQYLDFRDNNISEIVGLWDLQYLIWLYLEDNNLSSLQDIPILENLEFLGVAYNQIKDLSSLEFFTNLQTISLQVDQWREQASQIQDRLSELWINFQFSE